MRINTHYLKKIGAWLLPYTCILCQKPTKTSRDLCTDCLNELPLLKKPCTGCAYPLPPDQTSLCQHCQHQTRPFTAIYIPYFYQAPIMQLILELKFRYQLVNAQLLGELLTEKIQSQWYTAKPLPDILIPIPLHAERLKERGFNQAIEIARPIAKALRRPLLTTEVQRTKATLAQARLNAIERQQNVANAFAIHTDLTGLHVAVIDDVMTTGETMVAFCHALKQAGASQMDVWCCARAVKKG